MKKPIRIKITSKTCEGNVSYLVINKGKMAHLNQDGIRKPFHLLCARAVELQFKLEDAVDADAALSILKHQLGKTKEVSLL